MTSPDSDNMGPLTNRKAQPTSTILIWLGTLIAIVAIGASIAASAEELKQPPSSEKPNTNTIFPRRMLFISISKYMYLNPLTTQREQVDLTKPTALRLAYDWRIPTDTKNRQVFILSDNLTGAESPLPMKNVVQGTYLEFFKTSRKQDRIVIYFGGHAIEKEGNAYLVPMEAEPDGSDWKESLIPLEHFYRELQKCQATQKVVIWDVCRYNPQKGRIRPGSEPMSKALYKALSSPPDGIQAVIACKDGENAIEFTILRPDNNDELLYSGSMFQRAMGFVNNPQNNRLPKSTPTPSDPLPIIECVKAIEKRLGEMSEIAKRAGYGSKQTVTLAGTAPAKLLAPDPDEKAAERFEFPQPPKLASLAEIKSVERELLLPPLRFRLLTVKPSDFPFHADTMKDYQGDGVAIEDILKDKEKYQFRAAVVEALNKIRDVWEPGAGAIRLRGSVKAPINDTLKAEIKKEQEFWAIRTIELELLLDSLNAVAEKRKDEPKRWQANYDYALAVVKARHVYVNEYNYNLGNIVTESLPPLDPKLRHDRYVLVPSDKPVRGKDMQKLADEAQVMFKDIAVKYKGTPWSFIAKHEQKVQLGLKWMPASREE